MNYMQVKKKTSIKGDWVKAGEDFVAGDLITIKDGGKEIDGDYGPRMVFTVLTKTGEKIMSFNQTTMNNLIDAFGEETDRWAETNVMVWIVKQSVSGKLKDVVYLSAPGWTIGEDGFIAPEGDQGEVSIPTQDGAKEEVNVDDIPF